MKFNEELIGKLQEYYNNKNTRFSLFLVEVDELSIKIKRYNCTCLSKTIKIIRTNKELQEYLDEII